MTTSVSQAIEGSVRKSIIVNAKPEKAFRVFTAECDTWWPRTHHIGKSPMKKVIIEGRRGGRCYTEQVDGTECDWGTVLVWEPPERFVFSWQITPEWAYEPDLGKASEVEVRFVPEGESATRVELEHRYFERHGAGAATMRTAVDGPNGWGGMLQLFTERAEKGD